MSNHSNPGTSKNKRLKLNGIFSLTVEYGERNWTGPTWMLRKRAQTRTPVSAFTFPFQPTLLLAPEKRRESAVFFDNEMTVRRPSL